MIATRTRAKGSKAKRPTRDPRDRFTAHHEAGHAVMAWIHGRGVGPTGMSIQRFEDVMAMPLDGREALFGRVNIERHVMPGEFLILWNASLPTTGLKRAREARRVFRRSLLWKAEAQVLVDLAGYVAEHVAGREEAIESIEFCAIEDLREMEVDPGHLTTDDFRVRSLAEEIHSVRPHPAGVASWILDAMAPRAEGLLRRPAVWATVERVADALLERGKLTRAQFDKIVAQAPPSMVEPEPWEFAVR